MVGRKDNVKKKVVHFYVRVMTHGRTNGSKKR